MELPVLENAGSVKHQQALDFANEQYDPFAEKRRLEAQQEANQHYIEDLKKSAETLKRNRKTEGEK